MGSLCSKSDNHSGGTQVLGRSSGATPTSRPAPANDEQARAARAEAAEQRLKANQGRGVNAKINPNAGKLSAQLEASKSAKNTGPESPPERVVWD